MKPASHPTLRWHNLGRPRPEWAALTRDETKFHYTYNARGALYQLLRTMPRCGRDTILLPAFHCTTVVEPTVRAGWKVRFYHIRQDLSLDLEDLSRQLAGDVAAILVIHFLGFPTPLDEILQLGRKYSCYLIEDWAHSFLQGPTPHVPTLQGDFAVFSFYKHVPSFAGGGLRLNTPLQWSLARPASVGWRQTAVIGKRLLEQVIDNSPDHPMKTALQKLEEWRVRRWQVKRSAARVGEEAAQESAYAFSEKLAMAGIPWLSRTVLEGESWTSVFEARQRNYKLLAQNIGDYPLFRRFHPTLPPDVCPWAFPVWLPRRSEHDFQLRALGVPLFTFGEVLHPLMNDLSSEDAYKDARALSQHLLLLSVHQNLELADMERTAQIVNDFYKGRA
jgi:perosamine synthetase